MLGKKRHEKKRLRAGSLVSSVLVSPEKVDIDDLTIQSNRLVMIHAEIRKKHPTVTSVHLREDGKIDIDFDDDSIISGNGNPDIDDAIKKWTPQRVQDEMERTGKKWLNQ